MKEQWLRLARILIFIALLFASLGATPVLADRQEPPPPPPPGVSVDPGGYDGGALSPSARTDTASAATWAPMPLPRLTQPKSIDAAAAYVSSAFAATFDSGWNYRTSFESGETLNWVGIVNNTLGSSQSIYTWWYLSTPCGNYWIWYGWLTAGTGYTGWYFPYSGFCPGTHSFLLYVYSNGTYTVSSRTYEVGMLARATSWISRHIQYSQTSYTDGYRQDCSGYVGMVWRVSSSMYTDNWSTYSYQIPFDSLQPGDALNETNYPGDHHMVLFVRWVDKNAGTFIADEENSYPAGVGAQQHQITLNKSTGALWSAGGYWYPGNYFAIRRNGL